MVTGDRDAYLYLGTSISNFPNRKELELEIMDAGFSKVGHKAMTFSIVCLHYGEKNI